MTQILDQHGNPIKKEVLSEPQTANIMALQNQYLLPMLGGLTPARLARTLQEADNGNLLEQHRLFADMEERDGHLRAEMDKRKNAVVGLPWDVVPPRNASAAEKAAAAWVKEVLQDAIDPIEDLVLAMMDGVGHGFAPVELEWQSQGSELLPCFHPRPQEWFKLNTARTELRLQDTSVEGAQLVPFGWIMHTHGKAKTGYLGRMGLFRTLVWPFLYKAYALGDFAEFLETYGLPIIIGKYFAGATADEKASLMRAVTALGHDARAIMPQDMTLEVQQVAAGGSGNSAHLAMMEWADKSESKSILGQTLSADTGSKGGGSFALGKVHNEVRHDIRRGDARQLAATLTRDLVYPLIALNKPGIAGLARCPRFVFDLGEAEDLTVFADALPKLVGVGFEVPKAWAQEKLHIPLPQQNEPILKITAQPPAAPSDNNPAEPSEELTAVLSTTPAPGASVADPVAGVTDELASAAAPTWADLLAAIQKLVDQAKSLNDLQTSLVSAFGGKAPDELVKVMALALALAELKGLADAEDGK
ncbi:DUF935 domain-containing protein [Undibacterium sp. TJN25]|uniref:DUF935 domain-containing protein n=1 Tax=Undibacterium sp. TJN25 TaxID=3413056 RepID=UPI003BF1BD78